MSKPIFIVRFPGYWNNNQVQESRRAIHNMKELSDEYHILTLQDNEIETTKFECYN